MTLDTRVTDLTGTDLVQVHKEGKWNVDFEHHEFQHYFDISSFTDLIFSESKVNELNGIVIRYCLPQFFTDKRLEIRRITNLSSDGEYGPSFSNIEIAPGKYESRLLVGCYFVASADTKYVVQLLDNYHADRSFSFRIGSRVGASPSSQKLMEELIAYAKDHNLFMGQKIDAQCNFIKLEKEYTWDDIIISQELKDIIRMNVSNLIDHRDIYKQNKLPIKRGLIFSGPAGVGKTTVCKILCKTIDWTLIWVTPKFLQRASDIANIVEMAKELSPAVLFIEDIDFFGESREHNSNPTLLGELMNQLDGVEENKDIITIATTNRPEVLEKALLDRPGRFDKVVEFALPEEACRYQMLKNFLKSVTLGPDVDLNKLVTQTTGFTGAQIKEIVSLAVIDAIDTGSYDTQQLLTILPKHLEKALVTIKGKNFDQIGFSLTKVTSAHSTSTGFGNLDDLEDM